MSIKKDGLLVGIERFQGCFFVSIHLSGKLSYKDYKKMTPLLESAILEVEDQRVKLFFNITDFKEWERGSAWEDFRLYLSHGAVFEKVAIYGNKEKEEFVSQVKSWFLDGEIMFFSEWESALNWLRV